MWRKEEVKPQAVPPAANAPAAAIPQPATNSAPSSTPLSTPAVSAPLPISPRATACVTHGIKIKGEIIGKEDLFVDGSVEGKMDLGNCVVTVGSNGRVKADITAREIVVRGQVEGKLDAVEKVQLWNTGRVEGEVRTERLAIEDGAVLRGKIEAGKLQSRSTTGRAKSESSEKAVGTSAAASQSAVI